MTQRMMKVLSENMELHNAARSREAMPEVVSRPAPRGVDKATAHQNYSKSAAMPVTRKQDGKTRSTKTRSGAMHRRRDLQRLRRRDAP